MLIQPHILSLITTHRCTAACDHCCFSCHPERDEHVPVPNLHKYIEQAAEVDSIKVVAFTGGECFLLGKDLDELVNTASRNRLRSRFVSNGYWASSPREASKNVARLKCEATPRHVCRVMSATSTTSAKLVTHATHRSPRTGRSFPSTQASDHSVTPVERPNRIGLRQASGPSQGPPKTPQTAV